MGHRVIRSSKAMVVCAALLPAVVFACVVLIQDATLTSPDTKAIAATPAPAGVPAASWQRDLDTITRRLSKVSSDQSAAITYGWIGVVLVLMVGAGLGAAIVRRPADIRARQESSPDAGDRSILIEACIDVSDTVPTVSHRDELIEALARVGVEPVEAKAGEMFDAKRHRAVGRVPTDDPSKQNLIAETERVGFIDHGRRLRYPAVSIYMDSLDGRMQ
jgi:hypothetical protein